MPEVLGGRPLLVAVRPDPGDVGTGAGGGYRFAGNAKRLTLMDIIQVFESKDVHSPDKLPSAEELHAFLLIHQYQHTVVALRTISASAS